VEGQDNARTTKINKNTVFNIMHSAVDDD